MYSQCAIRVEVDPTCPRAQKGLVQLATCPCKSTEMTTSNPIKPTSKTPLHRMELYAKLLRSGMYYVAQWCPRSPPDRQLLILKPGVVPDSTV